MRHSRSLRGTRQANFTTEGETASKFGVHEIVLTGDGAAGNPFDKIATARFVPPSGEEGAKTVHAFYDGGDTWRARVYSNEVGTWEWTTRCETDEGLNGKSGGFTVSDSKLHGRLLPHSRNPRQWMTEDGRWFLNLNDTAYFLLSAYDAVGGPVKEEDVKAYVRDIVARGITSVRSFALIGPGGYLEDGARYEGRWRDSFFEDDAFTRLRLPHFRTTDGRLRWLLDEYPDLYVQFILFSRGSNHGRDTEIWQRFTPEQKELAMRTMVARYAAYPQLFWLATNDAHYGPDRPNNNAYAREVGAYFHAHDPWGHPMATGHARGVEYHFAEEAWSTYVHLEDNFDVGATKYARYHVYGKPVFLGEDRYEQDHPGMRDPEDMRYFQRRLFWAWLLSGSAGASYGGRWWVVHPYTETGKRPSPSPWPAIEAGEHGAAAATFVHTKLLRGLDSVRAIRDFFETRRIELSDFEADHGLAQDADGATGANAPRLMRRGHYEYLIYHPNAAPEGRATRPGESPKGVGWDFSPRTMRPHAARTPGVNLDLSDATGRFGSEWYRAVDGAGEQGGPIEGGKPRVLRSPWRGEDCVLWIRRE